MERICSFKKIYSFENPLFKELELLKVIEIRTSRSGHIPQKKYPFRNITTLKLRYRMV